MAMLDLTLLLDLGLIIIAATVLGYVAKALKQPPLIAYIAAGLLIGPYALGSLGIRFGPIPVLGVGPEQINNIIILSELGVAFLLFSIAAETNFSKMFQLRNILFAGGILQVLLSTVLVFFLTFLILPNAIQAIYIGFILAFSSTMMVVKVLSDKQEINTIHGRLMVGFLLVQDVIVILLLPLIAKISTQLSFFLLLEVFLKAFILFAIGFLFNKFILPKLISYSSKSVELFYLSSLSVCFLFIILSHLMNFSIAVGAFIGGLAISNLLFNLEIVSNIKGLRNFFATIFFVTLGMQINFSFINFSIPLFALMLFAVFILKPIIFSIITFFSGYGGRISLLVGLGLAQVSEFSFILLNQGFNGGQGPLSQEVFSSSILVIGLSMALTPYIIKYDDKISFFFRNRLRKIDFLAKFFDKHKQNLDKLSNVPLKLNKHIVLFGCGETGKGFVSTFNETQNLVVVDNDPKVIEELISKDAYAIYGSVEHLEALEKAGLTRADLLVITIPNEEASIYLTELAKQINPDIIIFARAHHNEGVIKLYEKGADLVIAPETLASTELIKNVSNYLEKGKKFKIKLRKQYLDYVKNGLRNKENNFKI